MTKSYKRGFTLIELLVVIAIIGILSSIVLASLNSARKKGRDARRVSDIKQLQLALELSYDAVGAYPLALNTAALVTPGYIAAIPVDPTSSFGYAYAALVGGAANADTCSSYHLGTRLETSSHVAIDADADAPASDPVCTGGGWAGNTDIAVVTSNFEGVDPVGDDTVFDVKP